MRKDVCKHSTTFIMATLTAILLSTVGRAQAPGRPRDSTPFARPQSLIAITTVDPRRTLAEIVEIVRKHRFDVANVNWDRGELHAVRKDAESSEDSDQVLVWLERDFVNPTSRLSVYFFYARFEKFFGSSEGPVRVRVDTQFEQSRISALKNEIVRYAFERP